MDICKQNKKNKKGFTLIELLIVIAIIGISAGVIFVNTGSARDKAKKTQMTSDMKQIAKVLQEVGIQTGLVAGGRASAPVVPGVTMNFCSACPCWPAYGGPPDLRNISSLHACYTTWQNSLAAMEARYGLPANSMRVPYARDPWGSPYLLDENEKENMAANNGCNKDLLRSVGPDGAYSTADDTVMLLPFTVCAN